MKMIDVPKVEKEAYSPDRPISGLIQMQLVHLSAAEQTLPPKQRTGVNIATLHTERQAAEYIGKITPLLHRAAKVNKKTSTKKSTGKAARTKKKRPAKKTSQGKTRKPRK
jgi:cell envelope opacity-associated protein A